MRIIYVGTLIVGLCCLPTPAFAQRFLDQLEGVLDAEAAAADDSAPKVRAPGYLGFVAVERLDRVVIETVRDGSAAQRAGLQVGDVITRVDGREVRSLDQLGDVLAGRFAGDSVAISVFRDGRIAVLRATLAERPRPAATVDEVPPEPDPFAADLVREPSKPKPDVPIDSLDALRTLEEVLDAESPADPPAADAPPKVDVERKKRIAEFESELEAIKRRIRELEREVGELSSETR